MEASEGIERVRSVVRSKNQHSKLSWLATTGCESTFQRAHLLFEHRAIEPQVNKPRHLPVPYH
jgi:hypothetical protein